MVVGSREKQSLGRQGRVSAEATRSGGSRWARLLRAAGAAAAGPMHLGRQGRVSAEATRYALRGTVSPRRVSDAPGGYWLARCGGRVTLARPPVLRVAFFPGGLGGRGGGAVTDTKALAKPLYRSLSLSA